MRLLRSSLVTAQVALTLVLLVGAGLLIQSFFKAIHSDPGFDAKGVYAFKVILPDSDWKPEPKRRNFRTRLKASCLRYQVLNRWHLRIEYLLSMNYSSMLT